MHTEAICLLIQCIMLDFISHSCKENSFDFSYSSHSVLYNKSVLIVQCVRLSTTHFLNTSKRFNEIKTFDIHLC